MIKVFVYGTLMKGNSSHKRYLGNLEYLGAGEITGYGLYAVRSYPGIVPEEGERVKGELYEVDEDTLKRLDYFEDEGDLYIRQLVEIQTNNGSVKGYAYIWNRSVSGVKKVGYEEQPWKG